MGSCETVRKTVRLMRGYDDREAICETRETNGEHDLSEDN